MTANPADPAATASATAVMMGLGVIFRPGISGGKTLVTVSGVAFTNTAAVSLTVGGRYGTSAPPANGAAVTGSRFAVDQTFRAAAAAIGAGFALTDILGLLPGTTYWLDLAVLTSAGADTAAVANVSVSVVELP